ncbi:oligopeptide transport system permease protein [Granulicatella balaenopterae]|uniref:Oligopeptide transport system permease protein n=1 Tax=Granulicatella balaenopterae TaxID=137733 RepID=A0A1H9P832_9LACT|nr:oligopeptide ABC transporter permease [Granulicatella balaenopterae]SER43939.1 oligopeptide transport system permease protein [Granulicatella balaenopterae]
MKNYLKYIGKRVLYMIATLFLIATATFFLMKLLPGSPFANEENLTEAQLQFMNARYGLDKPLYQQYLLYMWGLLHGDLGMSFQYDMSVNQIIASRIGPSFQLGIQAMIFGTVVGTLLGMLAAVKQNTWVDTVASIFAIIGRSVPSFVFAVVLQLLLAVVIPIFPIALWNQGFKSSVLPTLALAISPIADSARFVRTEMVEVLHSDYIELAKSKGLNNFEVAFKHGFRNAIIPLITILGPMLVGLMTGSMVVENIFSIPGIGEQFVKSIFTNDYPTIMGVTLLYSFMLVTIVLFVDILYGIIDPRIRLTEGGDSNG